MQNEKNTSTILVIKLNNRRVQQKQQKQQQLQLLE